MTTRRSFLRTLGLATVGALVVGPEALEAFARLTHVRKSFPSAAVNSSGFINVLDFGAVGDGVTNDREAIQRAIDFAARSGGRSPVLLPERSFNLGELPPLNLHAGTRIVGDTGAMLHANPSPVFLLPRERFPAHNVSFA